MAIKSPKILAKCDKRQNLVRDSWLQIKYTFKHLFGCEVENPQNLTCRRIDFASIVLSAVIELSSALHLKFIIKIIHTNNNVNNLLIID